MPERDGTRLSRRALLRLPIGDHVRDRARERAAEAAVSAGITFDSPVITPIGRFYRQLSAGAPPAIDRRAWTLAVDGLVRRPLALTYDALRARPAAGDVRTLISAANPPGGGMIGNAAWRGCRLTDLLAEAGILPGATHLRLSAADGYSAAVALDDPGLAETLLAYEMNGALLPAEHGGPLRALVPGLYGAASVRWLAQITVTGPADASATGIPPVRTCAQIVTPRLHTMVAVGRPVAIQGVAFAGLRGIAAVEVSVDGGDWMPAILRAPDSPHAWTQWYTIWMPEAPGEYTIAARATDGAGHTQVRLAGPDAGVDSAYADAIHWIVVRAAGGGQGGSI